MALYDIQTVHPSAARTVNDNTAVVTTGSVVNKVPVMLKVSAFAGVGPTLDVSVHWSHDGVEFYSSQPGDSFTQIAATTAWVVKTFDAKAPFYRVAYTLAGTTPSYTMDIKTYALQ